MRDAQVQDTSTHIEPGNERQRHVYVTDVHSKKLFLQKAEE